MGTFRIPAAVLAVAAALLMALAGCGQQQSPPAHRQPARPLTHQQYLRRGNAICNQAYRAAGHIARPYNAQQWLAALRATRANATRMRDQLRALRVRGRDAVVLDRYLATLQVQINFAARMARALARHDLAGMRRAQGEMLAVPANEDALAAGLRACTKDAKLRGG